MNETPIDPINLRAEIEMLQGQTRAMRSMLAALILASTDPIKLREQIAIMQGDLQAELNAVPKDADHARKLRLWSIGSSSAQRDLESMLGIAMGQNR